MKKINWQLATVYELAVHISKSTNGSFRRQLHHYRSTNNALMLTKIDEAKKIADAILKAESIEKAQIERGGKKRNNYFYEDCA